MKGTSKRELKVLEIAWVEGIIGEKSGVGSDQMMSVKWVKDEVVKYPFKFKYCIHLVAF